MDVLHVIESIFNKADYAIIGLLAALVVAVVFTDVQDCGQPSWTMCHAGSLPVLLR